ncbi:hypothetical protein [Klebsiella phage 05F01]|nr:hypothetical protein [Klebsiella phage 05F01]
MSQYKEGEVYKIYRVHNNIKEFVCKITINNGMCQKEFNRMLFFKYNLTPNDYKAIKIEVK